MEKMNIAPQQNPPNMLFLIISILSWLLLTVNNFASLKWLYREPRAIWNIYAQGLQYADSLPIPLKINEETIYKIFNFFIVITFIGCATFIFKAFIKKDQTVLEGMLGKYSKFHFVPLLFGFGMSFLGELLEMEKDSNGDKIAYAGLILSLVGLACMIFVYINTNINSNEWWVNYVLNKGTFSCLIILFWYNFCYDIYLVRHSNAPGKTDIDWSKGVNLAFSIIFGIGSMIFSFVFKDIIICLINIFIYNDLAGNNITEKQKEELRSVNYNADGAIDYLILICSFLLLIHIIVEKVKGMIDQMKNQIVYLDAYQKQIVNGVNAHTQSINQLTNLINSNKKNE
jgi:hypothetical protein